MFSSATVTSGTASTETTWRYWTDTSKTTSTGTDSWQIWTSNTTSVTGTTTASTVWDNWTSSTAVTSTGSNDTLWSAWANQPVRSFPSSYRTRRADRPRVDAVQARQRADKLLVEQLTEEQELSLAEHGYFDVDTFVDGEKRRFRIHNDKYQHNVFEIDETGQKLREYCAHTSHACPQSDHALAQKLLLEHNPAEFFRVANIWDVRDGLRNQVRDVA